LKNINELLTDFDVGFNSLSTFNKAFKKRAQMTPSQYLNNPQQSEY